MAQPEMLLDTIEARMEQLMLSVDVGDEQTLTELQRVDPNNPRAVSATFISGLTLLNANVRQLPPYIWVRNALRGIPPILSRGLDHIEFIERFSNENENVVHSPDDPDAHEVWRTVGRNIQHFTEDLEAGLLVRVSKIILRVSTVDEAYADSIFSGTSEDVWTLDNVKKTLQLEIEQQISRTIAHEIIHHAVQQNLPIAVLRNAVRVFEREDITVTDNVRKHRRENSQDLIEEDLADTLSLFLRKPAQLFQATPLRFQFCMDILPGYYDASGVAELEAQREAGTLNMGMLPFDFMFLHDNYVLNH